MSPYLAAFTLGLLGSLHCAGMCGGIAGALSLAQRNARAGPQAVHLLTYNAGRIASYVLAGTVAAALGAGLAAVGGHGSAPGFPLARLLTALLLMAMGVYVAGWWRALAWLERGGAVLWARWLQPLARRLPSLQHPTAAFAAGMVWGWLPCGLVYSALLLAAVQAQWQAGALSMAAFGLGTLPAMLLVGGAAQAVRRLTRAPLVRAAAGLALVGSGLFVLYELSGVLAAA